LFGMLSQWKEVNTMAEIYRGHEAPQQFDAAKARMKYAEAAGMPDTIVNKQQDPDVRTDVAALVFDKQTGKAAGIEPVQRQDGDVDEQQTLEASALDTDAVAADLEAQGMFDPQKQEVVVVNLQPRTV
jgi:hypothetical protein